MTLWQLTERLADRDWRRLQHRVGHACHSSQHWLHLGYLGAVWFEAHGAYGNLAGVLLCVTVVAILTGEGGAE